jgi:hypothetical protein
MYAPSHTLRLRQVEEHFGACLSSVAARAHIHAALSAPAAPWTVAVEVDERTRGADDWEHVPLFDEPAGDSQGWGKDPPLWQDPPQHAEVAAAAATAQHAAASVAGPRPSATDPSHPTPTGGMAEPSRLPTSPARVMDKHGPGSAAMVRLDPTSKVTVDARRASALFRRLRRRLARTRRYNRAGRFREAREQAAAVLAAAAAAGCGWVAEWAARMLGRAGYATSATLDDLELRIDTAEALWAAGGGFA